MHRILLTFRPSGVGLQPGMGVRDAGNGPFQRGSIDDDHRANQLHQYDARVDCADRQVLLQVAECRPVANGHYPESLAQWLYVRQDGIDAVDDASFRWLARGTPSKSGPRGDRSVWPPARPIGPGTVKLAAIDYGYNR